MGVEAVAGVAAGVAAVLAAVITSIFARPKQKADAVESLTSAAVSVVEQLRADNRQLRDDLDKLHRIVEEQQAEIARCEQRYQRLAARLAASGVLEDPEV